MAVREACEALSTVVQDKVRRRDANNTNLMKDSFSDNKPSERSPRLRYWEYDQSETWRSIHDGMRFLGMGCFMAVRNINSHGVYEELSEQEALEAIAVASLLARKVESASVLRHEDDPLYEAESDDEANHHHESDNESETTARGA